VCWLCRAGRSAVDLVDVAAAQSRSLIETGEYATNLWTLLHYAWLGCGVPGYF